MCVCVFWGWERELLGAPQAPAMSTGAKKEETYRTEVDPIQSQHGGDECGRLWH